MTTAAPVSTVSPPIDRARRWRSALFAGAAGYLVLVAVLLGLGF
ncbi:MAG: hypothetical protein ABIM89_05655 [Mycobacteriales bacterium]